MTTIDMNRVRTVSICAWGESIEMREHIEPELLIAAAAKSFPGVPIAVFLRILGTAIHIGLFGLCACGAVVAGPRFDEVLKLQRRVRHASNEQTGGDWAPAALPDEDVQTALPPDAFAQRPGKA